MDKTSVTHERWKYLGGSDMPIIMGVSPFKTRWELLQEKAQISESDFQGNEYTRYGDELEPIIRDYVNELKGTNFHPDVLYKGNIRANLDGWDEKAQMVLEIKTTSQIHSRLEDYESYLYQLLFYMYVEEVQHGLLAVYERPQDFSLELDPFRLQLYEVNMEDFKPMMSRLLNEVSVFQEQLALLRENPTLREEDFLPTAIQTIRDDLTFLEDTLEKFYQISEVMEQKKKELLDAMETYGVFKITTDNGISYTYVAKGEDKTKEELNTDAVLRDYPELMESYMKTKTVKGKAAHLRITKKKK